MNYSTLFVVQVQVHGNECILNSKHFAYCTQIYIYLILLPVVYRWVTGTGTMIQVVHVVLLLHVRRRRHCNTNTTYVYPTVFTSDSTLTHCNNDCRSSSPLSKHIPQSFKFSFLESTGLSMECTGSSRNKKPGPFLSVLFHFIYYLSAEPD